MALRVQVIGGEVGAVPGGSAVPSVPVVPAFNDPLSTGLLQAGQDAQRLARELERQAALDEVLFVESRTTQFEDEVARLKVDYDAKTDPVDPNYKAGFDAVTERAARQALANPPKLPGGSSAISRRGMARLQQNITSVRNRFGIANLEAMATAREDRAFDIIDRRGNEIAAATRRNPGSLEKALSTVDEALADFDLILDADEKRDKRAEMRARMLRATAAGFIDRGDVAGAQRLVDGEFDADLDEQSADVIRNAIEQEERDRVTRLERLERLSLREQRRIEEDKFREALRIRREGGLTPEWITQNEDRLSPSAIQHLDAAIRSDIEPSTDPTGYVTLRDRARAGDETAVADAKALWAAGRLQEDDYDTILNDFEGQQDEIADRMDEFIRRSLVVSDINPDPAAAQRQALALRDAQRWRRAQQGKGMTPIDAENEAERIVASRSLAGIRESLLTLPLPDPYFVGTRSEPDLDATEAEILKAYDEGDIDERRFRELMGMARDLRVKWTARQQFQQQFGQSR